MKIEDDLPLLENIFNEWKETIGRDNQAYKNHVYRVVNFCQALTFTYDEMVTNKPGDIGQV